MAERGLELSEEKTRITHIAEGLDFLGQNVRKYGDQLLTKPAKKSIKSLLDKVRNIIKGNATATQAAVIQQLNPVIRGWAMYHRHCGCESDLLAHRHAHLANGLAVVSAQAPQQRSAVGHQSVLPTERSKVLGIRNEGCGRRHNRRPATLPRVDRGGHPPCQGAWGCASVRPGMD